jgi:hypothetical protein
MRFEDIALLLDKLESGFLVHCDTEGQAKKKEIKKTLFYGVLRSFRENYLSGGLSMPPAYLIFSLLCPGEDIERKYGLKALSLSKSLLKIFGSTRRTQALSDIDADLSLILFDIVSATNTCPSLDTVDVINSLLDQLACSCKFSSARIKALDSSIGSQRDILSRLFLRQSPVAAKWLTRVLI